MVGSCCTQLLGGYEKKGACSTKDVIRTLVTRLFVFDDGETAFEFCRNLGIGTLVLAGSVNGARDESHQVVRDSHTLYILSLVIERSILPSGMSEYKFTPLYPRSQPNG